MAENKIKEELSVAEKAKQKRREYIRNWRRKNADKVKEYNQRYWAKKFDRDLLNENKKEV